VDEKFMKEKPVLPLIFSMSAPMVISMLVNSLYNIIGIYYKLQIFIYLTANGFVQGMRPIIGYNYGAKEYKRVNQIYLYTLGMNAVIMLVGTVICPLVPERLMGADATWNCFWIAEAVTAGVSVLIYRKNAICVDQREE